MGQFIAARQVERLHTVVGSDVTTGTSVIIEENFARFLKLFEAHLHAGHEFLLGSRPCAADFALFGQLHPMITLDPETSRRVFEISRSVWFWYNSIKDMSGFSIKDEGGGWFELDALPDTLLDILVEAGRMYAPFMLANAAAVSSDDDELDCMLDGETVRWQQNSFKYQAKCLGWLQQHYASLSAMDRSAVDSVLKSSDLSTMFAGAKL